MNLLVVSWDLAEHGHRQQGLYPNVMSCALSAHSHVDY